MKEGHPSWEYTVIIRENLCGKDLTKVSLIPYFSGKNYSWVVFDFPDINVTAGKKYYIISRAYIGKAGNCYGWLYSNDSNSYLRGETYGSGDHGKTWDLREGDCCFITYTTDKKN